MLNAQSKQGYDSTIALRHVTQHASRWNFFPFQFRDGNITLFAGKAVLKTNKLRKGLTQGIEAPFDGPLSSIKGGNEPKGSKN